MLNKRQIIGVRFFSDANRQTNTFIKHTDFNNESRVVTKSVSTKVYYYYTAEKFSISDYAIVQVGTDLKVVKVVEIDCEDSGGLCSKWVVARANLIKSQRAKTRRIQSEVLFDSLCEQVTAGRLEKAFNYRAERDENFKAEYETFLELSKKFRK